VFHFILGTEIVSLNRNNKLVLTIEMHPIIYEVGAEILNISVEKVSLKLEVFQFVLRGNAHPCGHRQEMFRPPTYNSVSLHLKERHSKLNFMFYSDVTCKLLNCISIGVPKNSLQFLATDVDYPLLFLLLIVTET
jgi:hypothetical protein